MGRIIVLLCIFTILPGLALAGTREDVLSGAVRCGAIADNRAWLDCFYGSAQPMRSQLGLPPAPASQTNLVPAQPAGGAPPAALAYAAPPQQPRQSGGFWSSFLGGAMLVNKMPAKSYSFDKRGYLTVTLVNGQVWHQESDDDFLHWDKPAPQYLITITKGALGSYNMKVGSDFAIYKVKRVQ